MMRRLVSSNAGVAKNSASSSTRGSLLGSSTTCNNKRSFVGFVPLDRHFARAVGGNHPSFGGARAGQSGGGAFVASGGGHTSADPLRSTSSAPLTPEDLFRQVMRNSGGPKQPRRSHDHTGAAADPLSSLMGVKPSSSTASAPSTRKPQTATASATPTPADAVAKNPSANTSSVSSKTNSKGAAPSTSSSNSTSSSSAKKEGEAPEQHPFMTLLETLGEAAPLIFHESLNHSTVEIELPLNVEIKNPKVSVNRPASASSSHHTVMESLLLGKKRGEGNVTVSADITPKLSIEKKVEQKKESDRVKEMLQQWGLPVEHVEVFTDKYGLDSVHVNPVARKFERTFFIDENTYNIEEATPFIEDGMLRLYVPKKKFTEVEKISKEVVQEAINNNATAKATSSNDAAPATAEKTSSSSSSPSPVQSSSNLDLKSLIPEEAPKVSKVIEDSTTTSISNSPVAATTAASATSLQHAENFSSSFAPRAPVNSSTHGTVAWPPRVETCNENPKWTQHSVSIPTAVDADTIVLDIVDTGAGGEGFAQDSNVLKLEVQQKSTVTAMNQGETQVFTFYRFFEVPAEVDVDAVTCDFDAESRELTITVPKPEPKKAEMPRRRIQINKKQ